MNLEQIRAQRQEALRALEAQYERAGATLLAVREKAAAEGRSNLTEDEDKRVSDLFGERRELTDKLIPEARSKVAEVEELIKAEREAAEALNRRTDAAPRPEGGARVTSEPEVYRKHGRVSFFRDQVLLQSGLGTRDAQERMASHDRATFAALQERALTTTDGAGGEFVPPLWMMSDFIELARAGSVVADQVRQEPLPAGTDSINLPRLATGTAVAEQATQNTQVQSTDATTNSVSASVATIAGEQVLSLQLIEQSPINMDTILLADLAADYAIKKDIFTISNNAAGKLGLRFVSGINAVTYTDPTPTFQELWPKLWDGVQQISAGRLLPPDKGFMHPRRWAWLQAGLDTTGRPVLGANGPMNAVGTAGANVAQGYVGNVAGVDWYTDPNIPTNLGAGTNEDIIIIIRSSDVILFEGTPRSDTFRETLARQLSVVLRFYNYVALHSARYPKSITTIGGTGLTPPTF